MGIQYVACALSCNFQTPLRNAFRNKGKRNTDNNNVARFYRRRSIGVFVVTYKYDLRHRHKMPKESKNYKRMMAEIIKKKNTVKTENDRKKIKQSEIGRAHV